MKIIWIGTNAKEVADKLYLFIHCEWPLRKVAQESVYAYETIGDPRRCRCQLINEARAQLYLHLRSKILRNRLSAPHLHLIQELLKVKLWRFIFITVADRP